MSERLAALRQARDRIDSGKSRYICYALEDIAYEQPLLAEACDDLRCCIMRSLQIDEPDSVTLGQWLEDQHILPTNAQLRMARLAWIDKMIEQFSDITQKD